MKLRRNIWSVLLNVVAFTMTAVVFVPMLTIVVNAFKTQKESSTLTLSLPKTLQWDNFSVVIERGKLGTAFTNSLIYSFASVALIVLITLLAAFVISRNKSSLNLLIYTFVISGIAIPINYMALIKWLQTLGLMNTRVGVILVYTAMNLPISLFMAYGFMSSVPRELDESAIIDGCGFWGMFVRIILPLLKPVVSTLFVLNFLNCWNEFMLPLYLLNSSEQWPMTLAVYNFFGLYERSWNLVCADILLTCLPVLVVFLLGQKYIIDGLTSGAVKG